MSLDTVRATHEASVYDFSVSHTDVLPDEDEAGAAVSEAEALGAGHVERWWMV